MYKEEKELWVKFACAALANCVSTLEDRVAIYNKECAGCASPNPADMIDEEDLIEEDCNYAAQYADKMVDLFKDKFENC